MTEFANHDAERSVLASVIALPPGEQVATYARLAATVRPADFDDPRNAVIWEAMGLVTELGQPVDVVTLQAALHRLKRFHTVGGVEYLREVAASAPEGDYGDAHAGIVADRARRRLAIKAADAHRVRLLAGEDVAASLSRLESESRDGVLAEIDLSARSAVLEAWDEIGDPRAVVARWGVRALDEGDSNGPALLGGLFAGQLTILGAIPGGGKTTLAVNASVATARAGGRVLFGALEMPRTDIAWRLAVGFYEGDPPSVDRIRQQRLSAYELTELQRASRHVSDLPILIDDRAHTVDGFCALARAEHSRAPLSLIVVDYMHLLERDPADLKAREDQVVRRQAYGLKSLAKKLRVPVLALGQFNRTGANNADRPRMFHMLGGSGIEQAADNVLIAVPDPETMTAAVGRVSLYTDKRRGGATSYEGRVVAFDRPRQRFRGFDDAADTGAGGDDFVY